MDPARWVEEGSNNAKQSRAVKEKAASAFRMSTVTVKFANGEVATYPDVISLTVINGRLLCESEGRLIQLDLGDSEVTVRGPKNK